MHVECGGPGVVGSVALPKRLCGRSVAAFGTVEKMVPYSDRWASLADAAGAHSTEPWLTSGYEHCY